MEPNVRDIGPILPASWSEVTIPLAESDFTSHSTKVRFYIQPLGPTMNRDCLGVQNATSGHMFSWLAFNTIDTMLPPEHSHKERCSDYSAESPILGKFNAAAAKFPHLNDLSRADVIVVPALPITCDRSRSLRRWDSCGVNEDWWRKQDDAASFYSEVAKSLPLLGRTSTPHLFVYSKDATDFNLPNAASMKRWAHQTVGGGIPTCPGLLRMTLGPIMPATEAHEIVVPPAVLERALQPMNYVRASLERKTTLVFMLVGMRTIASPEASVSRHGMRDAMAAAADRVKTNRLPQGSALQRWIARRFPPPGAPASSRGSTGARSRGRLTRRACMGS